MLNDNFEQIDYISKNHEEYNFSYNTGVKYVVKNMQEFNIKILIAARMEIIYSLYSAVLFTFLTSLPVLHG